MFNFVNIASFWGHTRCQNSKLEAVGYPGKTTRILAMGNDGSVRLFPQVKENFQTLCTVLPPPIISLKDIEYQVTYSRNTNFVYLLVYPHKIWVYTSKTDPACRIAEWNVNDMLSNLSETEEESDGGSRDIIVKESGRKLAASIRLLTSSFHVATSYLSSCKEGAECRSLLAVFSPEGFQFHNLDGICSAISRDLLLVGLHDGRILFVNQKNKKQIYGQLKANKDAIIQMQFELKSANLVTFARNEAEGTFQVWKLPALELIHTVFVEESATVFAIMSNHIITGHLDGSVKIIELNKSDIPDSVLPQQILYGSHKTTVIDIQSSETMKIFCTCGSEGDIKIWSTEKELLTDIRLQGPVTSCTFLNSNADLVISWKSHLFLIKREAILCGESNHLNDTASCSKESFIYEDPAIKKELLYQPNSTITDINNYLVPYKFIVEKILGAEQLEILESEKEEDKESETSESTLQADTEVYFSAQDSLCNSSDISEIDFPDFGISPCSTPSSTTVAETEDVLSSEEEFDESIFQVKESRVNFSKEMLKAKLVAKAISKMKHDEIAEEEPEQDILHGFSNIQIDAKSIMKKSMIAVLASEKLKKSPRLHKSEEGRKRHGSGRTVVKKTRRTSTDSTQRRRESLISVNSSSLDGDVLEEVEEDLPTEAELVQQFKGDPLMISPMSMKRPQTKKMDRQIRFNDNKSRSAMAADSFARRRASEPKFGGFPVQHKLKKRSKRNIVLPIKKSSFHRKGSSKKSKQNLTKINELSYDSHLTQVNLPSIKEISWQGKKVSETDINIQNVDFPKPGINVKREETLESNISNVTMDSTKSVVGDSGKLEVFAEIKVHDVEAGALNLGLADTLAHKYVSGDNNLEIPQMFLDADMRKIYEKDYLKFEKGWQDRVIEHHKMRKLQEYHRHTAATQKRIFLEQERLFKLYTTHPELMRQSDNGSIDAKTLQTFIFNSLLKASKQSVKLPRQDGSKEYPPRAYSVLGYHDAAEEYKQYRLSVRPKSSQERSESSTSLINQKKSSSHSTESMSQISLNQVRTSASIPTKTRYILLHPDSSSTNRLKVREPSKLEANLLKNRFPSQYFTISKEFEQIDSEYAGVKEQSSFAIETRSNPHLRSHKLAQWHDLLRRTPTEYDVGQRETKLQLSENALKKHSDIPTRRSSFAV